MATTYTGYIKAGDDYSCVFDKVYPITDNTITIPSNVSNTATVKATCNNSGWLHNTSPTYTAKSKVVLCDSAGNNAVEILVKELAASGTDRTSEFTKTIDISGLKGKRIYGKVVAVTAAGSAGVTINTQLKIELTTTPAGDKVTAGNKILATDRSQTGTATTQGAVMTDSHFSAGTVITASAFNSAYDLS